ncbi:uncharacterized protein [Nicotiana tomentosiformis]|uniref:uncharacterized protein n=1 Tax=Nicotiana tomentosiformis TaxID=4098 RepID=UPI00388CA1C5
MLEELTKQIESGEKKIEANDKKVETYNSRIDQIRGAPPILKGLDSRKFVQKPFPPNESLKSVPKKFRMLEIPKYNRTTNPNEHVTSYTCAIKGNYLEDDEFESVLLKKFGETLSKRSMIWYHNLLPNSIDSFAMLVDSFVKAHAGTIKVETRKLDFFKVRQKDNEMLREFVSRFQMERMDLPPVADDWAVQAFTQGLNVRSLVALQQLKQNLIEYPDVTWADVHSRYQSKIGVEDDQLGSPSGSVYPIRPVDRIKRDIDPEPRSNRGRYQPYNGDRMGNEPGRNPIRGERRNDRGQSSRGLISKNGFDRHTIPKEAPRLSEYNFNVDASTIVSAIESIKNTKWPRPLQTDPTQRDLNQICKYHGTQGHRTEDCRQLREEVARLFNDRHLRVFLSDRAKNHFRNRDSNKHNKQDEPQHVIHMIIGGVDVPQGPMIKRTKVLITREKWTRDYIPEGNLSFNDEDAEGIIHPHNDALVIFVLMNKTRVKCVLINPAGQQEAMMDFSANGTKSLGVKGRVALLFP